MSEINLLAIILETIFICNQIYEVVQMLACMDHFCYTTKNHRYYEAPAQGGTKMRHLLSMALCLCLLIPVSTSEAQEKPADTGDLSAAVELLRTVHN